MYYDPNNPIKKQISLAKKRIGLVAQGHMVCAALFGPPGIGKTFLCRQVFRELNMVEGPDWMLMRGSGVGLLHNIYAMRNGGTLLLDDCDELVIQGGQTHTNRMKEFLASEKMRRINNFTKAAMEGKDSIPATFFTTGGAVWSTNLDPMLLDTKTKRRIEPLMSRGMIPCAIDSDPRNVANYVLSLIQDEGIRLVVGQNPSGMDIQLNREEANDVLRYFATHAWNLETICFRSLNRLAQYRRLAPSLWRDMADQELRRNPICDHPLPAIPYIGTRSEAVPSPKTLAFGKEETPRSETEEQPASKPNEAQAAEEAESTSSKLLKTGTKAASIDARIKAITKILADGPSPENPAYRLWVSSDCRRLNGTDIARGLGLQTEDEEWKRVPYAIRRAVAAGRIMRHSDKRYSATMVT